MGDCCSIYGECMKERHETNYFSVGMCSMRGVRKSMEDSYCICLSIPNHPSYSLFAIFDGFNGNDASKYLRNNLIETLNNLNTLKDDEIIIDALKKMDKIFLNNEQDININAGSTLLFALINQYTPSNINMDTSSIPMIDTMNSSSIFPDSSVLSSLSTALSLEDVPTTLSLRSVPSNSMCTSTTMSLIPSKYSKIRIFWAGDSRALLIKDNNINDFEVLTIDHHCSLEGERNRIRNPLSNGTIINNKIDGITELSRCFGSNSMKNDINLTEDEQKQVCIAECKHILCKSNQTLLLFSDGLTQKWSNNEAVKYYNFHYNQHKDYSDPMQKSLNYLCEQCIDDGSRDNITSISIKFK